MCPQVSFETSRGSLWASNWQNILGKPIMRQRIFFFLRFGWRTFSVGQLHISKAQKHIGSAHEWLLRPPEDCCGHQTGKTSLETQSGGRELFSCQGLVGELILWVKFTCARHRNILDVPTSDIWDLQRTFVGIKLAKHPWRTNHDPENFFVA